MIKIRINALDSTEYDLPYVEKETLQETFDRFLLHQKKLPKNSEVIDFFNIYINGELISKDRWKYIRPKKEANVLIALTPQGRDFRNFALLAAVTAATFLLPGAAPLTWASFGTKLAFSVGVGLLAKALIKPPDQGHNKTNSEESSQTYTISGQSNQLKTFGYVPKVYGKFKMFPNIVANPYTKLEIDPVTKKPVQYFYCIYDFGYGPNIISDLRIGETLITNYNSVEYNLVDLNRPLTDQGDWDIGLKPDFLLYKNDVSNEEVGVALNKNQTTPGAVTSEYQVIRNVNNDSSGDKKEISILFAFPRGLYSLSNTGAVGERRVLVNVEFREIGSTEWININNELFVENQSWIGPKTQTFPDTVKPFIYIDQPFASLPGQGGFKEEVYSYSPFFGTVNRAVLNIHGKLKSRKQLTLDQVSVLKSQGLISNGFNLPNSNYNYFEDEYDYINFNGKWVELPIQYPVGTKLYHGGTYIGKVTSVEFAQHIDPNFAPTYVTSSYYRHFLDTSNNVYMPSIKVYVILYQDGLTNDAALARFDYEKIGPAYQGLQTIGDIGAIVPVSASLEIIGNSQQVVYAQLNFTPIQSLDYEIRITRVNTTAGYTYQTFDEMEVLSITTSYDRVPIITPNRHTFLEIKIKATDQLNGTLQNLNAIVSSVLNVYDEDAEDWFLAETNNPAWIFADVLTGEINKKRINRSRLDTNSLIEYAEYCDEIPTPPMSQTYSEKRFTSNFVMDFDVTVSDLINRVLNANQASLNLINGKYGILIDKNKTVPVQLFTTRNSSGFSSNRSYIELPHGLKVKYIDSYTDWNQKDVTVYNDGYDANNATDFDELDTFGVTNFEQAYRFGRYNLAQVKLRQEEISINVDFENLVCTRGDFVLYQQDVMKAGGSPARVKSVSGNQFTIDDAFVTEIGKSYGYTLRKPSGIFTGTLNILNSTTTEFTGETPVVGDLIVWGEVSKITLECIVKAIIPGQDLTAQIILVEKASAIYDAESSDTIPDYDPQISTIGDIENTAPGLISRLEVTDNAFDCTGNNYQYYVELLWDAPLGSTVDKYEIYVNRGEGYDLADVTQFSLYKYIVDENFLGVEHNFKVLGVAANGAKKSLGEAIFVSATPVFKTTPPSNVQNLNLNITNETLQISWNKLNDCDIFSYLVRYSPNLNATWSTSIPLLRADRNTTSSFVQARTGSYLIKAIDFNGNESQTATVAITTIPELVNVNIVEETNDWPTLPGIFSQTEAFGTSVILKKLIDGDPADVQFYNEGFYYFNNLLDLGEIFTVRLQSLIDAYGYSPYDLMSNWNPLSVASPLARADVSEWDVETQYRTTNVFNSMASWGVLSNVETLAQGNPANWTEWRQFIQSDVIGRIFQFRLKLISNSPAISPRVINGQIRADMPDRVYSVNDVVGEIGGKEVLFDPPFFGPSPNPNIQITMDNGQSGDYYEFVYKSLNGFKIKFYDNTNTEVVRQFDAQVKGYGRKYDFIL